MNLTPATNTYITINDQPEHQILYFADRPVFHFPVKEKKIRGETILTPQPKPIWTALMLEIPTRPLKSTRLWMDSKEKVELHLMVMNKDGNVIEEWQIKEAVIASEIQTQGRSVDIDVIRLIVTYSWAGRIR